MARRVKRAAEPVEQPIQEVRPGTFQAGDLFSNFGRDDKPGWLRRRWRYAQALEQRSISMEMVSPIELLGLLDALVLEWLCQHHPDRRTDTLPVVFQLGDLVSNLTAQVKGVVTAQDVMDSLWRLMYVLLIVRSETEDLNDRHRMSGMTRLLATIGTTSKAEIDETCMCSIKLTDIALTLGRTGQLWLPGQERQLLE